MSHHKKKVISKKELVKKNAVKNVGTKKIKGKKMFLVDILGKSKQSKQVLHMQIVESN